MTLNGAVSVIASPSAVALAAQPVALRHSCRSTAQSRQQGWPAQQIVGLRALPDPPTAFTQCAVDTVGRAVGTFIASAPLPLSP